jgi:hypothetical protein
MVLPDSHGIPRAPRYLGTSKRSHIVFTYRAITFYGWTFLNNSVSNMFCNSPPVWYYRQSMPHYPILPTHTSFNSRIGLGSCPFAHHYSGNRISFSSWGYLDVSVHLVAFLNLCIQLRISCKQDGLSHSEIPGSKCVCHSPRHIAAYHVLHRQPIPRHSPYTLYILIIQILHQNKSYVLY